MDQKRLWCQQLKKSIIDNYEAVIPDKAKQLVMSVGADSAAEGLLLISSELVSLRCLFDMKQMSHFRIPSTEHVYKLELRILTINLAINH